MMGEDIRFLQLFTNYLSLLNSKLWQSDDRLPQGNLSQSSYSMVANPLVSWPWVSKTDPGNSDRLPTKHINSIDNLPLLYSSCPPLGPCAYNAGAHGYNYIEGETRSLDRAKLDAITEEITREFEQVKEIPGAKSEIRVEFEYPEYKLEAEQKVVEFAAEAIKRAGLDVRLETSGGGSDANIFNAAGLQVANLAVGMQNAHTTEEFMESRDLVDVTHILWEMVQMSAEAGK
jgi:hypothetical protein